MEKARRRMGRLAETRSEPLILLPDRTENQSQCMEYNIFTTKRGIHTVQMQA